LVHLKRKDSEFEESNRIKIQPFSLRGCFDFSVNLYFAFNPHPKSFSPHPPFGHLLQRRRIVERKFRRRTSPLSTGEGSGVRRKKA
jgi:hypothetical protein